MRAAIYKELKELYPTYYIGSVQNTVKPPFVILHFGTPIKTRLGSWNTFYVSVYAPMGNFKLLDEICEKIKNKLDKRHLSRIDGGSVFFVRFDNCTGDDVESRLKAITRQLNFKIPVFNEDFM